MNRRKMLASLGLSTAVFSAEKLGAMELEKQVPDENSAQFDVQQFGAKGDGMQDDTVAIQAAVTAAGRVGGTVVFPPCSACYVVGELSVARPVRIAGAGMGVMLTAKPGTLRLFTVRSSNVQLAALTIDMKAADAAATVIYLDTAQQSLHHLYFERLVVQESPTFLQDADGDGIVVHLHVQNIACRLNRGTSILLRDAFAYLYFTNVNIDNVPVVSAGRSVDFTGISITHAQGLHFEKCDVTGGNGVAHAHGFHLRNCEAVHFNTCMADYVGGDGFRFESVWYLYLVATVSSLCSHVGLHLNDCRFVNGTNVTTAGRSKMPQPPPLMHGILVVASSDFVLSTISSRFNTGDGIHLIDCQQTAWTALHLYDNDGCGLAEHSTNPNEQRSNILSAVTLKANKNGNYTLMSPSTHMTQAVLDSGELRVADHGPFAC